ncbi:sortase [Candidatus Marithioploca araucensis]|uniref:Sortase n=1 Tax=Candidatus Marithioploca araucensis TaxID=70273 RepID=A0ABT7VRW6_9GAMM|nr:sortase [Candidatus Marithioploca araucensis]
MVESVIGDDTMKKHLKLIGIILSLFLSIVVWQYNQNSGDIRGWLAQGLLHTAWIRTQASGEHIEPWPGANIYPLARLSIPHLNIEQVVLSSAGEGMSVFALGHSKSSVLPGELGNSVLNIYHHNIFISFLNQLKEGDILLLESLRYGRWHYQVSKIEKTVKKTETFWVEPSLNRRLTLISCYPYADTEDNSCYVVVIEEIERKGGDISGV